MEQSQVSNHLLVGGLEVSHLFTVVRVLSSMTHLLARQLPIDLGSPPIMRSTRIREVSRRMVSEQRLPLPDLHGGYQLFEQLQQLSLDIQLDNRNYHSEHLYKHIEV